MTEARAKPTVRFESLAPMIEQIGLGFVGGYIDTFSFIAMSGLFTAHVTGNLIVAGAGLLHPESAAVIPNLVMIPVFIASIAVLTYLSRITRFRTWSRPVQTSVLVAVEATALLLFEVIGARAAAASQFPLAQWWVILPVATLGVCALSIQNALTRITRASALPTTIMTGNLTQAAVSLSAVFPPWRDDDREDRQRHLHLLRALAPGLLGFFAGAVFASPLTYILHFHAVAVAVLCLVAILPACGRSTAAT